MKRGKNTFVPPFCPKEFCRMHDPETAADSGKWFSLSGTFRNNSRNTIVQRFRCRECGRYFSSSTFSVHYHAKNPINLKKVLLMLCSGASLRGIGRILGCKCDTVSRKVDILSRQSTAVHSMLKTDFKLQENLACDGFESFSVSQYFPNNFNITVGSESQFLYYFNYVQLRRKGKMTDYQKERADRLKEDWPLQAGRVRFGIVEKMIDLYRMTETRSPEHFTTVVTDENRLYGMETGCKYRATATGECYRIQHVEISSKRRRDKRNPLFPVNYMDREFRKDLAEHRRESTCFSRDVNNSVSRMSAYMLYHNCIKTFRVNDRKEDSLTHAERAGISPAFVRNLMALAFETRIFLSHLSLDKWREMIWRKAYPTPLKRKAAYVPPYAMG